MNKGKSIRWGILGPGWIARDFVQSLKDTEGAEVLAVGSRSLDRAREFAATYSVPRPYGSYEELVADPDVDIVYVATPHPAHKDNMLLCLGAGKPVLCEKPFTMNAREAEEVFSLAREKGLFVMEAMWTRWLPAMIQVRQWLAEGKIGEVKMLKAEFGYDAGWRPECRQLDPVLGGGAMLDAGVYPISLASMVMGCQPETIRSTVHIGKTGVDEQFAALFEYGAGRMAVITSAVQTPMMIDAVIMGTKGIIHIPEFFWAKSARLIRKGESDVVIDSPYQSTGKCHEAAHAMECLREGKTESSIMSLDESLAIMRTMDSLRGQWNLTYPCER